MTPTTPGEGGTTLVEELEQAAKSCYAYAERLLLDHGSQEGWTDQRNLAADLQARAEHVRKLLALAESSLSPFHSDRHGMRMLTEPLRGPSQKGE